MDQDSWEDEDYDGQQDADWEEDDAAEFEGANKMQIGRKTMQRKMRDYLAGTHRPSNRKPPFHRAPRRIAGKETLRTPIYLIDVTSCTRQK
jgi:hypothetical protein